MVFHRETIKPSSPTPHHLRTFKLSLMDQYGPVMYTPLVLFYPIISHINKMPSSMPIKLRSNHLRTTLSETLTRLYPLAGRLRGNLHIERNDEGAEYVEARSNCSMSKFLQNPHTELLLC